MRWNLYQQASEQNPFMSFCLFYVAWFMSCGLCGLWFIYIYDYAAFNLLRSVAVNTASERFVIGYSSDITRPKGPPVGGKQSI